MSDAERLVAVISPWDKLSEVVKRKFRVESLPAEKKVAVWRDDLQTEPELTEELRKLGVKEIEVRTARVTTRWQDIH
ncbi:MAG: hypothetical protein NUV77_15165 [Thermoguttaceae bacterium]|jgi:hypothetical protein|nr:hypothetical protein [Thermoguttaceae bacterium]